MPTNNATSTTSSSKNATLTSKLQNLEGIVPPPPPPEEEKKTFSAFFSGMFKPKEPIPADLPEFPQGKPASAPPEKKVTPPEPPKGIDLVALREHVDQEARQKKEELAQYERELRDQESSIAQLENQQKKKMAEIQKQQSIAVKKEETLKAKEVELTEFHKTVTAKHVEAQKLHHIAHTKHKEISRREELLARKEKELRAQHELLDRRKKEIDGEKNKSNVLRGEIAKLQHQMGNITAERSRLERVLTKMEAQHKTEKMDMEMYHKELKVKENRIHDREINVNHQDQNIKKILASREYKEALILKKLLEENQKKMLEWEGKVRHDQRTSFETQRSIARKEAALIEEKKRLDYQVAEHNKNVLALKKRQVDTEKLLKDKDTELAKIGDEIRSKESMLLVTENNLKSKLDELKKAEAAIAEDRKKSEAEKKKVEQYAESVKVKEKDLVQREKTMMNREMQWMKREEEIKSAGEEVNKVKKTLGVDLDIARKEFDALQKQWRENSETYNNTRGSLDKELGLVKRLYAEEKNLNSMLKKFETKRALFVDAERKSSEQAREAERTIGELVKIKDNIDEQTTLLNRQIKDFEDEKKKFTTWVKNQEDMIRDRHKQLSDWQDKLEVHWEEVENAKDLTKKISLLKRTREKLRGDLAKELDKSIREVHQHILKIQNERHHVLKPLKVTTKVDLPIGITHVASQQPEQTLVYESKALPPPVISERITKDEKVAREVKDMMDVQSEIDRIRLLIHEGDIDGAQKGLIELGKFVRTLQKEERDRVQYEMEELRTDLQLAML
jgi:hypothetical protein